MIKFTSYIKKPGIIIKNLSSIKNNDEKIFLNINNEESIKKIINEIDTDYIEGVIYLEYDDNILIDFTYWDIVDQLWAYMINLVDDTLKYQEANTYFPDQPIKLTFKDIENSLILFSIESSRKKQAMLPKYDFFLTILQSAGEFFHKLQEYFGDRVDYSYELDLIKSLKKDLTKVKE